MVSTSTLCKNLLNVKKIVIEDATFFTDENAVQHLFIKARPYKSEQHRCPICGRKCPGYDTSRVAREWRAPDFGGILVHVVANSPRVQCPTHGVHVAMVPWAHHGSRFTKNFEMTTAWLATRLSKSAVAKYRRISWNTVGKIISRVRETLEPDPSARLDGLVEIGIDETSYRKGHKYITVVVDHRTNTVVWAHDGHGKAVLTLFMKKLTQEQRESIRVVTADGARWITDCVKEYLPNCVRCIDAFHVVEWGMEALDKVRRQSWHAARAAAASYGKLPRGRAKADDKELAEAKEARQRAKDIKGSAYALGKAPENLTETQAAKLEMIQLSDNKLYRAYKLKEMLRLLLKMDDVEAAEAELKRWVNWARHCRIPEFVELQRKIMRHKGHILSTIRLKVSNARIESTNNKIKLIIRRSFGFRNIQNMLDMVLLECSNIEIPLPNRPHPQGL